MEEGGGNKGGKKEEREERRESLTLCNMPFAFPYLISHQRALPDDIPRSCPGSAAHFLPSAVDAQHRQGSQPPRAYALKREAIGRGGKSQILVACNSASPARPIFCEPCTPQVRAQPSELHHASAPCLLGPPSRPSSGFTLTYSPASQDCSQQLSHFPQLTPCQQHLPWPPELQECLPWPPANLTVLWIAPAVWAGLICTRYTVAVVLQDFPQQRAKHRHNQSSQTIETNSGDNQLFRAPLPFFISLVHSSFCF